MMLHPGPVSIERLARILMAWSKRIRERMGPTLFRISVVNMITDSREVTQQLSVSTRLCSDSGDDEIEHAVGPIRVGCMFVHHGDSVDES